MTDRDLTIALCELLAEELGWSWSLTEPYPAGAVGLFYGSIGDTPDRAVGVRVYGGSDPRVHAPTRSVQLLLRGRPGEPDGADALADAAFGVLHKTLRRRGILAGQRSYFGPLGADANGREERADNYEIHLDNMEAYHV